VTTRSASDLYLVDSSGWLEYLTEDSKASAFAHYLEAEAAVLVPSLVLFDMADRFVSQALQRRVVPFDDTIALAAAGLSLDHRLTTTDAIIYATARVCHAQLVTANTRFRGLPGVIIP
jgi:predicted nucleic acid-binding protein